MTHDHRKPPPDRVREEPYAEITQVGRWRYRIEIHHDLMVLTPPSHRYGRQRAERCARRQLARYVRQQQRETNPTRITADQADRATAREDVTT